MRELMENDVHQVLREIALMEMSLSKIGIEGGIDIPTKIVILTEEGAAVLRADISPLDEMIEHVNRSVDKGVVTAVVVLYRAKLAVVSEDDMDSLPGMDSRELIALRDAGRDVVVCAIQYQINGVGHTVAASGEIVMGADGSSTLGPIEFFSGGNASDEGTPLSAELVFDTSKFLTWTEN